MDRINSNNYNNKAIFKGGNMEINKNVKSLSDEVLKTVKELARRAEREVYQDNEFTPVVEKFNNPDKNVYADEIMLKVSNLPAELKQTTPDYNSARWLEVIVKDATGASQKNILKRGNKKEILQYLNDENLPLKVAQKIKELSVDLRSN